jgi:phosphohistidine phosphatase
MKTLLLMRHAKSSWNDEGVDDHDRPLNSRGERSAPAMGKLIVAEGLTPDLVVASTALRARATAFAIEEACDWRPDLRLTRALYMADPRTILGIISALSDEVTSVLVVAHNPGTEDLVSGLSHMRQAMPTAALARFDLRIHRWADIISPTLEAELVNVWLPREIVD